MAARDRWSPEGLAAMREELERVTREAAERIFSSEATGPRPSFKERDFGRWSDKVREEPPSRSYSSSFKETGKERMGHRSGRLFLSRAYLAVSTEPGVVVAAVGLRAALQAERAAFWKVGADGMRVYADEWFRTSGPQRLELAEAKLRRRIRAALIATTPSAEPELY